MRTTLIQADYVTVSDEDGTERTVPDLGTLSPAVAETGPAMFAASWQVGQSWHHFTLVELPGLIAGKRWFAGTGSPTIVGALAAHGVSASRILTNPPTPLREQFMDAGCKALRRRSDGKIMALAPPIVFAGQDPLSVALASFEPDDGEEYYVDG